MRPATAAGLPQQSRTPGPWPGKKTLWGHAML